MLLASWTFDKVKKENRSLNTENLGSVGQRAAKLPAIKLWEWFDFARVRTQADWFKRGRGRLADFSWDLQLWQLVTFKPFNLQTLYLQYWKI